MTGVQTCALPISWRAIDQLVSAARFGEVFEHFAANLAFWGAVGWCSDAHMRVFGVVTLLLLAAIAIGKSLRSGTESFAVYGVGYTALGLSLLVAKLTDLSSFGAALVLVIVLTAAAVLRHVHDVLKESRT